MHTYMDLEIDCKRALCKVQPETNHVAVTLHDVQALESVAILEQIINAACLVEEARRLVLDYIGRKNCLKHFKIADCTEDSPVPPPVLESAERCENCAELVFASGFHCKRYKHPFTESQIRDVRCANWRAECSPSS